MASSRNLVNNSDTLVDLLSAQCSELETLLALAREETQAAQDGKFLKVLDIVSERSRVGKRLETYHQQISELRGTLQAEGHNVSGYDITNRVMELANMTLVQDQKTRPLLAALKSEAVASLQNVETSTYRANAYLKENRKGLAFDRSL